MSCPMRGPERKAVDRVFSERCSVTQGAAKRRWKKYGKKFFFLVMCFLEFLDVILGFSGFLVVFFNDASI